MQPIFIFISLLMIFMGLFLAFTTTSDLVMEDAKKKAFKQYGSKLSYIEIEENLGKDLQSLKSLSVLLLFIGLPLFIASLFI